MERRQRAVGLGARQCALMGGCAGARGSAATVCFGVELARLAEIDCGSVPERERQKERGEEKSAWNQAFELLGVGRCS
jgi:hypothetical protein